MAEDRPHPYMIPAQRKMKQALEPSTSMAITQTKENGLSISCVDRYLRRWDASRIKQELCNPSSAGIVGGMYPILFFAVEQNSPELVRLLCRAGADASQPARFGNNLPVLAYCIMTAEYNLSDTTDALSALLAMGADPYDLPQDMWCNYIQNPTKVGPKVPEGENATHLWSDRLAARTVQEWLTSHALHHIEMPLVLLFTGPSGHGKTELAKRMGELLSLPLLKIDCTQIRFTTDLFGPQAPYAGHQAGSPLNNFPTDQSGQKAVVFLDEFEKTTNDVHKSLLLLFDEGFYVDHRTVGKRADCTKIIWVLASNQGVEMIQKYWDNHLAGKPEYAQLQIPIDSLQRNLEKSFQRTLGAPLTGRLSAIIPFLPFTQEERAVTTYKFMRKLFNESGKPISVDAKHLACHLYLNYINDGQIASFLAEKYYSPELGARSLHKAVNTQICHKLTNAFLDHGEEILDEMNDKPWDNYDIRVEELKGGFKEITIKAKGSRTVQKRFDHRCGPQFLGS
ncbi:MAG: hypothetical protein Q9213_006057 [Squamulea squamosa]